MSIGYFVGSNSERCALALMILLGIGQALEIPLNRMTSDPLAPPKGDIKPCGVHEACSSVLVTLVEPHHPIDIPVGGSRDDFLFLSITPYQSRGARHSTTVGLEKRDGAVLVNVDFDQNGKLDEGPALAWPADQKCLELSGASKEPFRPGFRLCRLPDQAHLRSLCEDNKSRLTWAVCTEGFYEVQINDIAMGELPTKKEKVKIGVADADGDGSIVIPGPDLLLIDWDGDGELSKSNDIDGFTLEPGKEFLFSVGGSTFAFRRIVGGGKAVQFKPMPGYRAEYEIRKPVPGRAAPDFDFLPMEDDSTRLSNFRGRKVLLNFWTFKEQASLEEFAKLREFNDVFSKRGWQVISLTSEPARDLAEVAARRHGVNWMLGLVDDKVITDYATRGLPANFIIDENGVLEKIHVQLGQDARR